MANHQCELFGGIERVCRSTVDLLALVQDSCRDLLAVLVAPSTMTIWNADTATKVSRFTFSEAITAFSFSPFRPENLVCKLVLL